MASASETGSDRAAASIITTVREAMLHIMRAPLRRGRIVATSRDVLEFLMVALNHQPVEVIWAFYLDAANQLLRDEAASRGTVSRAAIHPRDVIGRALELGASGIILAHNHPSGQLRPSEEDIETTNRLARACREVDIVIHDHLIVTDRGWTSLRASELLDDG